MSESWESWPRRDRTASLPGGNLVVDRANRERLPADDRRAPRSDDDVRDDSALDVSDARPCGHRAREIIDVADSRADLAAAERVPGPALGVSIGTITSMLFEYLFSTPRLTIDMPWWLLFAASGMATTLCLVSSVLPFGSIRRVDPMTALQD